MLNTQFVYDRLPREVLRPKHSLHRRIFLAGKGGVGKTTLAATIAFSFAEQGLKTLLITTDPAAHIGNVLGDVVTADPKQYQQSTLWIARIDPKEAFRRYKDQVLASIGVNADDLDTIIRVSEELDSPCTEEVAVFQKFLDYVLSDEYTVTVFDTAPTGHTIRLLQLSWDYERDLERKEAFTAETAALDAKQLARMQAAIHTLQNAAETGMFFVTLPESTPISEMERAMADLAKINIPTQAIIVNQVLPPEASTSRLFGKRLDLQMRYILQLRHDHPHHIVAVAPLQDDEIIGSVKLHDFAHQLIVDA